MERFIFKLVRDRIPSEERRTKIPRCVVVQLACLSGYATSVIEEIEKSSIVHTDAVISEIFEHKRVNSVEVRTPPPPESVLRDKKEIYSKAELGELASYVNPSGGWKSPYVLASAARHVYVFDEALKICDKITGGGVTTGRFPKVKAFMNPKSCIKKTRTSTAVCIEEEEDMSPKRSLPTIQEILKKSDTCNIKQQHANTAKHAALSEILNIFIPRAEYRIGLGNKTAANKDFVDSVMIFSACVVFGIELDVETTDREMKTALYLAIVGDNDLLETLESHHLQKVRTLKEESRDVFESTGCKLNYEMGILGIIRGEIRVSVSSSSTEMVSSCKCRSRVTDEDVSKSIKRLSPFARSIVSSKQDAVRLFRPESPSDAIAMAAIVFTIDISSAICPLTEYHKIILDWNFMNAWGVVSEDTLPESIYSPLIQRGKFPKFFFINPILYDVSRTWSDKFSDLYRGRDLEHFAVCEGFEETSRYNNFTSKESASSGYQLVNQETTTPQPPQSPIVANEEGIVDGVIRILTTTVLPAPREGLMESLLPPLKTGVLVFESAIKALVHSRKSRSIYEGWHPLSSNTRSPLSLDEIEDVFEESGHLGIITYGTIPSSPLITVESSSIKIEKSEGEWIPTLSVVSSHTVRGDGDQLVAYSVTDLLETFSNMKAFVLSNADGNMCYLSGRDMEKLKRIVRKRLDVSEKYKELSGIIDHIEQRDATLSAYSRELDIEIRKLEDSVTTREEVKRAFVLLNEIGMYMRGWKLRDGDSFPLKSMDTTYDLDKQSIVDVNVTSAISEYEEAISSIKNPVIRRLVMQCPLLRLMKSSSGGYQNFTPTLNPEQGFTVTERLEIVKRGDENESVFSCMRMSSNLLVASAYYYLTAAVGLTSPPFDISQLDEIL